MRDELLNRLLDADKRPGYDLPALLVSGKTSDVVLRKAFDIACACLGHPPKSAEFTFAGAASGQSENHGMHPKYHSHYEIMLYDLSEWTLDQNIDSLLSSCRSTSSTFSLQMSRRVILVHTIDRIPIFAQRVLSRYVEQNWASALFIFTAVSPSACCTRLMSSVVRVSIPCDPSTVYKINPKFKSIQSIDSVATYIKNGKLKPADIFLHMIPKLDDPLPWIEACAKGDHLVALGSRTPTDTITYSKYMPSKNIVLMTTVAAYISELRKFYVT